MNETTSATSSPLDGSPVPVDPMRIEDITDPDGRLIHADLADSDALALISEQAMPPGNTRWTVAPERRWRKIPAQWGGWNLKAAPGGGRGSFVATLVTAEWIGTGR